MTERSGGSDISGTETIAVLAEGGADSTGVDGADLGPWSISGFKWFSSATDAQMAVLLARTPDGKLSAFYAPMRRTIPSSSSSPSSKAPETELNGITIQRLKSKLGTRSLPTAELVLDGTRAYLLGRPGDGVRELATILNITRVHTAVSALGFWGRGLGIARAFARVRMISGNAGKKRKLEEVPAHVATLAGMEVTYRGWMHLVFFTVALLGLVERSSSAIPISSPLSSPSSQTSTSTSPSSSSLSHQSPLLPSSNQAPHLLRLLTPTIKALASKASTAGLAECMECLGGIGYLENEEMEFNIARLFRDCAVLSIWEGTTEVMASDLLRVVKGRSGGEAVAALGEWVRDVMKRLDGKGKGMEKEGKSLRERWASWRARVEMEEMEQSHLHGREIMMELGQIVAGILLLVDAERDGDEVAGEAARRWIGVSESEPKGERQGMRGGGKWREKIVWDRRIVFGDERQRGLLGTRTENITAKL
jgi:alkylation response protein AidB-like acyl-CoA dehydrogenase